MRAPARPNGTTAAEAGLAHAERLGGQCVHGPVEVPGTDTLVGHFTDPEGHLIGLVQA